MVALNIRAILLSFLIVEITEINRYGLNAALMRH